MIDKYELEMDVKGTPMEDKFMFIEPQEVAKLLIGNCDKNREDFVPTFKEKNLMFGYVGDYNGKIVIARLEKK